MFITYKLAKSNKQELITNVSFENLFLTKTHTLAYTQTVKEMQEVRTFWCSTPHNLVEKYKIKEEMLPKVISLGKKAETFLQEPLEKHYNKFYIPKKTGGYREINAPEGNLKYFLTEVKDELECRPGALAHNSAFAYVKGRCTVDAVKQHQRNKSNWYLKMDIKDFFTNCNLEFIINSMEKIFPYNHILEDQEGRQAMINIVKAGMLNDGLPQGTPLSPFLTNLIMIPIDFAIENKLSELKQYFIYTRYADDLIISSKHTFSFTEMQQMINDVLKDTPFQIKREKTRYGSKNGANWNLGLMLNKDLNITIGHKKKERFRAALFQFCCNPTVYTPLELQKLAGLISYYRQVEPEYFTKIVTKYSTRFNVDILEMLKNFNNSFPF